MLTRVQNYLAEALLMPSAPRNYGSDCDALRAHVATLPPPDTARHYDQLWTRPTGEFPLLTPLDADTIQSLPSDFDLVTGEESVSIAPSDVLYTKQKYIRLDALAHYLTGTAVAFDAYPWFPVDCPVVYSLLDGYVILDGNHRALAARMLGRPVRALIARAE